MNDNKSEAFDYKIPYSHCMHVGRQDDCDLPQQAEVERAMDGSKEGHATFLLCTPTSILPAANRPARQRSPAH
jgi:hypothetical protein